MKRVLIVRLDAIGDYILWRNCLRFLRDCTRYRDAHLTVLGNPVWRDIAETFDKDCADEWIWAENRNDLFKKGYENLLPYCVWHRRVERAQLRLKAKLIDSGFDEVVSPCAFPDALLDEFVTGIAPVTISVANEDSKRKEKFSRLLDPGTEPFVFCRNLVIAAALADEPCDVQFKLTLSGTPSSSKRILFFQGASHWTRRWPKRRWRVLGRMLPFGYDVVLTPKGLSLPDFAKFVASCAAVVSNDTMALHLAAALGVPAVGVSNGVSGRGCFWPYPAALGKRVEVCSPGRAPGIPIPLAGPRLAQYMAISSVSPKQVVKALRKVMGSEVPT